MSMDKKAQVAAFVILGVILLAAVAIGFYFRGSFAKTSAETEAEIAASLPADVAEARAGVAECVQYVLEDGVVQAGMFGGHTEPKADALFTGADFVNYGLKKKDKMLPSIPDVQENIASYIEEALPGCIDIGNEKIQATQPKPKANVKLLSAKVTASVEYRAVLKQGDNIYTLSEPFEAEANVKALPIYEAAAKIVSRAAEQPETIDVDYLLTLGEEIDVIPIDEKNVVYRMPDKSSALRSEIGNVAFTLVFAAMS